MNEVLDRINNKMKEKKVTARKLCEQLQINESNFVQWKNGKQGYLKHISKIAQILGVTVDYLLTGENEQTEAQRYYEAIMKASERDRKIIDILLGF